MKETVRLYHHDHGQAGGSAEGMETSREEAFALLTYMLDHNRHHAEELHELAHAFENEAAELIHEAVAAMESANEKLAEALAAINTEE